MASTQHQGSVLGASTESHIVERIIEASSPLPIVSLADLAALESRINLRIDNIVSPPPFPQQIGGYGSGGYSFIPAAAQRIDQLANVTITNPTIVGGSLSGTSGVGGGSIDDNATTTTFFSSIGHFTTGIIDALTATAATIANLGTTELVATNSTTTNLYVSGTTRLGSGTGVLQSASGVVSAITNGSDGQVLKIIGGAPAWSSDLTGSGGGSSAWATTTDSLAVYTTDPTQVILVGTNATSTTGNILEVKGNTLLRGNQTTQGVAVASSFTATSSATSSFSGGLSVLNFSQTGSATSTGANGWNIAGGCYAINNQCLSFSSLAGLISLSSQVTGTLPVANGGTGSTTLSGILKGNGTGAVQSAVAGVDYLNSTAGDWSGTLGGFSSAQLIALGFATTSADAWKSTRNFYSTTSADYWLTQKTTDNIAEGSTNKYWSNTLFDNRLSATTSLPNIITLSNLSLPATQLSNFGVPFFQFLSATTTTALAEGSNLYYTPSRVAGVIAGTTTSALAEGNNLYFTNARGDARINATSSIGTLTAAPNLVAVGTVTSGTFSSAISGASINATPIGASSASTAIFTNATTTNATTSSIYISGTLVGAGLSSCSGSGDKLLWNVATLRFECGGDAGAGGGLTGLKGQYSSSQTGATQTFATSSDTNLLLTITSSGDTHTFAPVWTGTLAASRGGTGISNPSAAGLLLGSYTGGTWQQLATSSLGLFTTNIAEGSNLYYTADRVAGVIAGTTTTALAEGTNLYFTNARADTRVAAGFAATTTTALAEGSNLYYTDARVSSYISGSSTVPHVGGANFGEILSWSGSAWVTRATSTLALNTTDLVEGSNLFWSNTRFDNRLSATTSLPNIITLANLSLPATQLTSFGTPFYQFFSSTTTSALAEGNNLYFTNARADARINATSTIGTLTSAPNLGTVATSLTGFLKATAGVLSTALIDLASSITGILPVGNGGTGWASLAAGAIPYGNGSSAIATTTAGTNGYVLALVNGIPSWVATTTLSTISGTLAAGSGGTGISNPSAAGILLGSYAGGSWHQLATSSLNINTDNLAEGASNLFWTNTRFDNRLSATTSLPNIISLANLANVGSLTATSLNVLSASQFANSVNFFGLTSFGATGTTTITAAGTISTPSIVANSAAAFTASFGATATSTFSSAGALSLAGGLNGPLHSNNGLVNATTSIGVLYGGTGLTTAPSYGNLLLGQANGTYALTATSSLGLPTFSDLAGYALASAVFGKAWELNTGGLLAPTTTRSIAINGSATSTFAAGIETPFLGAQYFVATSSTATSSFANGIRLLGGCFQLADGSCAGASAGGPAWGAITGTLSNQSDLQSALDAKLALSAWYATTTTALAEGTNRYWTDTRFDNRLSATTSLPNIITLANLSLPATQLTSFGIPFYQYFSATTTDALAEGSSNRYFTTDRVAGVIAGTTTTALAEGSNKYFTDARADARINATSTIGTLTSAPNLGTVATSLSGFLKATAGVLSTALIDLASNITGILPVGNGGTGWASLASGAIPYGNGSSAVATTSSGTAGQVLALLNGVPTWTATTTLSTISGTLAAGSGGTGITNPSAAGILLGSYAGGSWQQLATSSLGLPSFSDLTSYALASSLFGKGFEINAGGLLAPTTTRSIAINGSATSTFAAGVEATSLGAQYIVATSSATSTFAGGLRTALLNITSSATSSATNGWNITSGCYAVNNTCLSFSTLAGLISLTTQVTGTLGVGNGGTGNTLYASNALLWYDGTKFAATSTQPLYVGSLNATSTNATSTFGYGINLLGGCLARSGNCLTASDFGFIASGTAAVSRSAQSRMRDIVSVRDFGALCNAVETTGDATGNDDFPAFLAAVAALPATGGKVYVPSSNQHGGTNKCRWAKQSGANPTLVLQSGVTLEMDNSVRILVEGTPNGVNGYTDGAITNSDQTNGNKNISVIGGAFKAAGPTQGSVFVAFKNLDRGTIRTTFLDNNGSARGQIASSTNIDIDIQVAYEFGPWTKVIQGANPSLWSFEDGFRIGSGSHDIKLRGTIHSGDDSVALSNEPSETAGSTTGSDIYNIDIGPLIATSQSANALRIYQEGSMIAGNTYRVNIHDLTASTTNQQAGGATISLGDYSNRRAISNVTISHTTIDAAGNAGASPNAISLINTQFVRVNDSTIFHARGYGIGVNDAPSTEIDNVQIYGDNGSVSGVILAPYSPTGSSGSNESFVTNSLIKGFQNNIEVIASRDVTLTNNKLQYPTSYNIKLAAATTTQVSGNSHISTLSTPVIYEDSSSGSNRITNEFFQNSRSGISSNTLSQSFAIGTSTTFRGLLEVGEASASASSNGSIFLSSSLGGGYRTWRLGPNNSGAGSFGFTIEDLGAARGADLAIDYATGNVGIGTTTPWRKLSVTGTVGLDGLTGSTGAGSLCLDSNKQVVYNSASDNCLSSTRATKHDVTPLSLDDLQIVNALQPVSFVYSQGDGRMRYGFIAEDTAAVDAHLATYNASGIVSGIDDRSILAILVGAVKDLWEKVIALVQSDEEQNARIARLEAEVAALKSQSASAAAPASTPPPSSSLTVNGNNPAEWSLNTPWQDNLGALFSHDGIAETIYSTSSVDTSLAGTTTIDYWAQVPSTSQWLHSTRHIVIPAPANDNQPPAHTDEEQTAAPEPAPELETGNDNEPESEPLPATGTDATTTAQ